MLDERNMKTPIDFFFVFHYLSATLIFSCHGSLCHFIKHKYRISEEWFIELSFLGVNVGPITWLDCRGLWSGTMPKKLYMDGKQRTVFIPMGCGCWQWNFLWISRSTHGTSTEYYKVCVKWSFSRSSKTNNLASIRSFIGICMYF